jgi:hypothetical protein
MHIIDDTDTALATVSRTRVGLMAEDGRVAALTKPQARSLWLEFRDHSGRRRLALGMRPVASWRSQPAAALAQAR